MFQTRHGDSFSSIYIRVHNVLGAHIEQTARDSVELSKHLQIPVEFTFNNVICRVWPESDPAEIAQMQQLAQARGYAYMGQARAELAAAKAAAAA